MKGELVLYSDKRALYDLRIEGKFVECLRPDEILTRFGITVEKRERIEVQVDVYEK